MELFLYGFLGLVYSNFELVVKYMTNAGRNWQLAPSLSTAEEDPFYT